MEKLELSYVAIQRVNDATTLENNLEVSYKIEHALTTGLSNQTLRHLIKRNENTCPHSGLHVNVHRKFIHNSQKLAIHQVAIGE